MCEILVVSRGSSYATCKMLETRRSHVTRGVQPSTMDGLFPLSRYAEVVLVTERITEICSPNHQVKKVKKASKPHGGLENDLCFHEKGALTALWITCLSDTFGGIITIIINNNINIKINILTLVLLFFTVIKAVYHYPSTSKPNQMPRDPAEVDMPAPQSTTMFWHLWSLIYLATPGVQNLIQTNYSPVPLGS